MSHADDLQAVSIDEALIDVTSTVNQLRSQVRNDDTPYDPAKDFAETIPVTSSSTTGYKLPR